MQDTALTILAVIGFAIIFPLFWMAAVYVISRFGGWSRLAASFPATRPATGEAFGWCSARFANFANYSNCLNITVSSTGIHIEPIIFFRIGHPPLFVPWDVVTELRLKDRWLFSITRLTITDPDGSSPTTLTIYGRRLGESLHNYAPRRLTEAAA